MSFRAVGGYYRGRAGDYGYRGRRGDLGDIGVDSYDFSDVTGGSSSVTDPTYTTMGDPGSGLSLPGLDWGSIGSGLGLGGAVGIPSTISGIISAFGGGGGGGGAQSMPGGAPTGGTVAKLKRMLGGKRGALTASGRRHPHMNPMNVKAARRSLRRLHRFSRIARQILHVTNPPRTAHVKFRFRRRRRK